MVRRRSETRCSLTRERLVELFFYHAETGQFVQRFTRSGKSKPAGSIVGCVNKKGYVEFMVDGWTYKAHRLAWLYVKGVWPKEQIDHIDGNKSNNRFANLREATNTQNQQNIAKAQRNSRSGILGVRKHPDGKWVAEIGTNGGSVYLGLYATPELASQAYQAAKAQLHEYAP